MASQSMVVVNFYGHDLSQEKLICKRAAHFFDFVSLHPVDYGHMPVLFKGDSSLFVNRRAISQS